MSGQGGQPLAVDIGLSNARSMPSTPATTPPGNSLQTMQQYQNGQAYDSNRTTYTAPPASQGQYAPQNVARFGQPLQPSHYIKHEMRPPAVRALGSGLDGDRQLEGKTDEGLMGHGHGDTHLHHTAAEDVADQDHGGQYTHDGATAAAAAAAAAAYGAGRAAYAYNPAPTVGSLASEHQHLSPEMNGSPGHHNGSGRATPRNAQAVQNRWSSDYSTPPRVQTASNSLYSVMSTEQLGKPTNGVSGGEAFSSQLGAAGTMPAGYPSQHTSMNGSSSSKRMRETDDDGSRTSRPSSRGPGGDGEMDGLKRRKTLREDTLPMMSNGIGTNGLDMEMGRPISRTKSMNVQRRR